MGELPSFTDQTDFENAARGCGVLTQTRPAGGTRAQLTLTLTKPQLLRLLATRSLDGVQAKGDTRALTTLLGVPDTVDNQFAIVTP